MCLGAEKLEIVPKICFLMFSLRCAFFPPHLSTASRCRLTFTPQTAATRQKGGDVLGFTSHPQTSTEKPSNKQVLSHVCFRGHFVHDTGGIQLSTFDVPVSLCGVINRLIKAEEPCCEALLVIKVRRGVREMSRMVSAKIISQQKIYWYILKESIYRPVRNVQCFYRALWEYVSPVNGVE